MNAKKVTNSLHMAHAFQLKTSFSKVFHYIAVSPVLSFLCIEVTHDAHRVNTESRERKEIGRDKDRFRTKQVHVPTLTPCARASVRENFAESIV
jgi:hypothetical protein